MREELKRDRLNGHLVLATRPYSGSDTEICQAVLLELEEGASSSKYVSCCYNCQTAGKEWFWGNYFDDLVEAAENFKYRPGEKPKQEVWAVKIYHRHGVDEIYDWTAEAAETRLFEYVAENWPEIEDCPGVGPLDEQRWASDKEYRSQRCDFYFEKTGEVLEESEYYEGSELIQVGARE